MEPPPRFIALLFGLVLGCCFVSGSASARPVCAGKAATVVGTPGADVIKTRAGSQVIVGLGGRDRIRAGAGKDTVCGGAGPDQIDGGRARDLLLGGSGGDVLRGGMGTDRLDGDAGVDLLLGGPGGERLRGGAGGDRLFGGLQDDALFGGADADLLAGGHGNDGLHGDAGNDWLRGDTEPDSFDGGGGDDWASFATATPPGASLGPEVLGGVAVSHFERPLAAYDDDAVEPLLAVENISGSAFSDRLYADSVLAPGTARGIADREDVCEGFAATLCGTDPRTGSEPMAFVDQSSPDPGLFVLGGPGGDRWDLYTDGASIRVVSQTPLAAGPGCRATSARELLCAFARVPGYLVAYGADGPDTINIRGAIRAETFALVEGGRDADVLTGGPGDEVLLAGDVTAARPYPADSERNVLRGGGGDDVLASSFGGPDLLQAGPGGDQLITVSPCSGHVLDGGGGGPDIAGFARSRLPVVARIGGTAVLLPALNPYPCTAPSKILKNVEILEGTNGPDTLIGSRGSDALILGGDGDDLLKGLGGADRLRGDGHRDRLFGGKGADVLEARDGERDRVVNCGEGGRSAVADKRDPVSPSC
jgi:Ca2+-binding RTX toxin-like protein